MVVQSSSDDKGYHLPPPQQTQSTGTNKCQNPVQVIIVEIYFYVSFFGQADFFHQIKFPGFIRFEGVNPGLPDDVLCSHQGGDGQLLVLEYKVLDVLASHRAEV